MSYQVPMMFSLAVLSVAMWTIRVAVAARGQRLASAGVAATEAVVFALTFSHLVSDLGSPVRVASYAGGVAAGTMVGLLVNDRVSRSQSEVQIMAPGDETDLVAALRARGWPATAAGVTGPRGAVTMVWLTVPTGSVRDVQRVADDCAPAAFTTVRRLEAARSGPEAYDKQRSELSRLARPGRPV